MADIYSVDDLRRYAPDDLKNASDERLIIEYSADIGRDPFEVANMLGVRTGQDRSAFGAGVSSGADVVQGLGISAVAGAADIVGADRAAASLRGSAEDQAYQSYLAGRPDLERIEDQSLATLPGYAAYQLGKQAPIFAAVAGAQAVPGLGQAATATGLARLGALAPRALGGGGVSRAALNRIGPMTAAEAAGVRQGAAVAKSTMVGTGLGFGSLYESSAADGDPDPWKALAMAPLYGAAEAVVPAALTGAARLKSGGYTGRLPTRMLKGGAVGGATEAATELAQTELELSLDPTLTSEERASARLNAAVAGGLVGGTLSTATGLRASAEIERQRQRALRENELGELDMASSETVAAEPAVEEQLELDLPSTFRYEEGRDEIGAPDPFRDPARPLTEVEAPAEVVTEFDNENQGVLDLEVEATPVAGAQQNKILSTSDKLQLNAKLEAKQTRLARLEKFKSKAKTPAARKAAEAKAAKEAEALRGEVVRIQRNLAESNEAVDQRVAQQGAVQVEVEAKEPEAAPTLTSEQKTEAQLQAQQDLASEIEAEGVTLVDEYEANKIGQTVDKLNADIQATEGKAGGRVTLPKGVLTGITAMIRSSNTNPAIRAYKDGTAEIDPEYMQEYGEQMRRVYNSAMRVVELAQVAGNAGSNIDLGMKEESKESRKKSRGDRQRRYKTARQKLAMAMDDFVSAAGGAKNAEAIISAIKVRNEKNRSSRFDIERFAKKSAMLNKGKGIRNQNELERIIDTLLSSSFKEYKDGTLGETDVVRGAPTRRNFRDKALDMTPPLVDSDAAGGILAILDRVGTYKGTTSPYVKSLVNQIRKVFEGLESDGAGVNIEFLEDNGQPKPNYDPATNTVSIHREASQEEILHESLHAAMQFYVYQNPESSYVKALSESLDTLLGFVDGGGIDAVNMSEQHKARALEVTNLIRGLRETGNELDAILELSAYGTTMRDFRMLLKEISEAPSEATQSWLSVIGDVWRSLVDMFANLLGVEGTVANNVLDNTLAILDNANFDERDPTVGGNRLDMSVLADNDQGPVDADGRPVGDMYRDAAARGKRNGILSTQFLFDAIGFDKNVKTPIAQFFSDAAAVIRREVPAAERVITYFNSRFSLPPSMHNVFDIFKEQRNSVYMVMERLAMYVESQPKEKVIALMDYLDGDITALDGFENSVKLKEEADIVLEGIETYVRGLPQELQAEYDGRKFSDYLIYVTGENTVSTQSLGMSNLGQQIKAQGVKIDKVDFDTNPDLVDTDANGDPDMDSPFYEVIVRSSGNKNYRLMVSKSVYERRGGQLPIVDGSYTVNTDREFSLIKLEGADYRFKSKFNYREALDARKAKDLANAMRNTVGGLANYYSSRNFLNAIAITGKESGVVFDSEGELRDSGLIGAEQSILTPGRTDSEQIRQATRRTGAWVQIPNTPETYGELAGKMVHGPVYHAMRDMADRKPLVNVRAYNDTLRFFKKSKTIYNLGTHVTNVASNVTLAMLHDIPVKTVADAARLMYKYEMNSNSLTADERAVMREFMRSGAMLGNYSSVEVKNVMFKSMAKHLKPQEDTVMTRVTAFMGMEADKANMASELIRRGKKADEVATQLYAAEDNVFRLAAFIKSAGDMADKGGLSNPNEDMLREAGRFARQAFLDYDIDAPAVKFLRQSFLPFVSWTYAIIPVLGRIAANQPWKIANVLSAYALIDVATSALAGDDDELRKLGPEKLDERVFGIPGLRMHIRIPFLGDDENPVYYRLGDYVPLASTAKGLPNGFMGMDWFPGGLTPGGPFINAIVAMSGGVDPYTRDPIHQPEDGNLDKLFNIGIFAYDQFMSPMIRSGNLAKVRDAIQGNVNMYSGREVGVSNLIFARIGGLKFVDFNVNEEAGFREMRGSAVMRDYKSAISRAKREEIAKGYPDYEALDKEIQSLTEEMYREYNKVYKIED